MGNQRRFLLVILSSWLLLASKILPSRSQGVCKAKGKTCGFRARPHTSHTCLLSLPLPPSPAHRAWKHKFMEK